MPKKVVVAMSGGVDSSVAAYLLKQQGYEVIGMMMRLWSEPGKENSNRCCTPDSVAQAKKVASKLDIPFYVLDSKDVFYDRVVQNFIEGYKSGVTPNPCLACNRWIRFDHLYKHAQALGAEFFSTGHYVQKAVFPNGNETFKRAIDEKKDQSYVLHVIDRSILPDLLFPIGVYPKSEIRAIAESIGLSVAKRPDSQDLCFLAGGDYRDFLRRHNAYNEASGEIRDLSSGQILGEHYGLINYTIGQRKGLGFAATEPFFVVEKDRSTNTLIVGKKSELGFSRAITNANNWFIDLESDMPIPVMVKSRYTAGLSRALLTPKENGSAEVVFDQPQRDLTSGQAAVYYQNDLLLGGGTIVSTTRV